VGAGVIVCVCMCDQILEVQQKWPDVEAALVSAAE